MPEITIDGRRVQVAEGTTVAAAAMPTALCGMGVCFQCCLTVDGVPHSRTCLTPCRDGMIVERWGGAPAPRATLEGRAISTACDILVVGAGPAGIAAACAAAESGRRVAVLDDNPDAGGQIWRASLTSPEASTWIARFRASGAELHGGATVIDAPSPGVLDTDSGAIRYDKLVLATGARERFLPFPGWTLPHVAGAGGLQALVKGGLPIAGKRVVVAGSGPLLLAVAAYLRKRGAIVPLIAEQAPASKLASFATALSAAKLTEAIALRWQLRGVRYRTGTWPIATAAGEVMLRTRNRTWREACDYLACGFGLVPNLELPMLLGCSLTGGFVAVDDDQRTSLDNIYCAGEPTGIGGLEKALVEGLIAGYSAAGDPAKARPHFPVRARARRFQQALDRAFPLRDELKSLAPPETIICRCEDVTIGRVHAHSSWRSAKLHTRCGMGPCQGRVCGAAVEFILGWQPDSVRPPIFPVSVARLSE